MSWEGEWLTEAAKARIEAANMEAQITYPDEFPDEVQITPNESVDKEYFFNPGNPKRSHGWKMEDVMPKPKQVTLQLSTEDGGFEENIEPSDIVTEVLDLENFDTNFPYNRRKLRQELVDQLGLQLAATGQKSGGSKRGRKCLRFAGDQRVAIRTYLLDQEICRDELGSKVDDDGFAAKDPKSVKIARSNPLLPTIVFTELPIVHIWLMDRAGGSVAKQNRKLLKAAKEGNMLMAEEALKGGCEINCRDNSHDGGGKTALMFVVTKKWLEPKTGRELWQPLTKEYLDVMRLLFELQWGADPDLQTEEGYTALHFASVANQTDAVEILLAGGAKVNSQTKMGYTSLMEAAAFNYVEVCNNLLSYSAGINIQDVEGWTALMRAANRGQVEVVEVLLGFGASRLIMDKVACCFLCVVWNTPLCP
jgi:hypothetical protein